MPNDLQEVVQRFITSADHTGLRDSTFSPRCPHKYHKASPKTILIEYWTELVDCSAEFTHEACRHSCLTLASQRGQGHADTGWVSV